MVAAVAQVQIWTLGVLDSLQWTYRDHQSSDLQNTHWLSVSETGYGPSSLQSSPRSSPKSTVQVLQCPERASFNQNESELVSELVIELYNFVSVFTRGFTRLGSKVISWRFLLPSEASCQNWSWWSLIHIGWLKQLSEIRKYNYVSIISSASFLCIFSYHTAQAFRQLKYYKIIWLSSYPTILWSCSNHLFCMVRFGLIYWYWGN